MIEDDQDIPCRPWRMTCIQTSVLAGAIWGFLYILFR